ncbi:predicted protein [Sclerotinia sclerotiorum 1980 UF-70]|uniref:Uncharacterized protein n=1 Tax=Sclerotinia sclerotiorum (strain ATCC 18683 / 1980 / Ss-1) TaxID=665079 RepID=A7E6E5_SCLS1|nr:predicted protein [Sclerotinia sclerotiorum 1980 UF-70]EDN91467.1 predicted protein [Sclerotinia sclerotiorum 1980 UF-70]
MRFPHSNKAGHFSPVNFDYGPPLLDPAGHRLNRRPITEKNTFNDVPLLTDPASPIRPPQHRYKKYNSSYSPPTSDSSAIDTPLRTRELLPTSCFELAPDQTVVSPLPDTVRAQHHGQNEQSNSKNTGHSVNWRVKGVGIPESLDYTPGAKIIVTTVSSSVLKLTAKGTGCQRSKSHHVRFQPYSQAGRRNAEDKEEMDIDIPEHSPTSISSHMHPTEHETSNDQRRESARDAFTTPSNPFPEDSPLPSSTSNTGGPRTFSQSAGTTTTSSRRPAQSATGKLWKAMYGKDTVNLQKDLVMLKSNGVEDIDLRKLFITVEER